MNDLEKPAHLVLPKLAGIKVRTCLSLSHFRALSLSLSVSVFVHTRIYEGQHVYVCLYLCLCTHNYA